ncbi:hypothetical protein [Desulfonatronospira sp.]|uniref:hypothetical protein n=1 Tax=Desulfonatronospira sp. TaxID=1962951 RepID=UPI0025C4D29F|nr:hypothetical protein [Desulfonatronospira sp.]
MRKVKILLIGMLVMMLSGTAWAASYDDHVKIAPNNQGDVLIFPFYAAIDGGFETKLTVVNTSRTESTVAKVVVRSEVFSQELLDFLIYLSPSDVWTGTLRWDAAKGGPVLFSDDDSILVAPATFATPDNPVNQPLVPAAGGGDSNMMGYVYVINAATAELVDDGAPGLKVRKSRILDWYQPLDDIDIVANYPPQNILAGFMDFNVRDAFLTSGLNAVTLRDYVSEQKLTVRFPTLLGEVAQNNRLEVEAVLSKLDVSMPYVNTDEDVTLHFFTFPTKYHYDAALRDEDPLGPFFRQNADADFCVKFAYEAYDLQENKVTDPSPIFSPTPPEDISRFCRELNWVDSMQFAFEEGFTRYDFMDPVTGGLNESGEPLTYTGAPVIPMQLNLGQTGLSMKYGAWTDGIVKGTIDRFDVEFFDYHYSDTPNHNYFDYLND